MIKSASYNSVSIVGLCFFGWRLMSAKKGTGNLDRKFKKSDEEEAEAKDSLNQSGVRQLAPPVKRQPNLAEAYAAAQNRAARRVEPKTSATQVYLKQIRKRVDGAQTHQPGGRVGLSDGAKRLRAFMEGKGLHDGHGLIDAAADAFEAEFLPPPPDNVEPPEGSQED